MPYSYNEVGPIMPGETLAVTFPFLNRDHVSVLVNGDLVSTSLWSWLSDGVISALPGFPAGSKTRVRRRTPVAENVSTLLGAAVFDFGGVNTNDLQLLYALQERSDDNEENQASVEVLGEVYKSFEDSKNVALGAMTAASNFADEAAGYAEEASTYASVAMKNWQVDTFIGDGTSNPLVLTANPGSAYNCVVTIEGEGPQPRHIFSLDGKALSPPSGAVWPTGKGIEVAYGTSIEVGTPADGSVTESKLGTGAVTEEKLAASSVTEEKLGAGAVTNTKLANEAVDADKFSSDPADLAAMVLKLGIQPSKLKNISLVRDTALYSTSATTTALNGNISRSVNANSPTSSLLVLTFLRLEVARDATIGTTGMSLDLQYYNGSVYSSIGEVLETLDTDGPASHLVRTSAAMTTVLSAAQKRSDISTGNGQWTVAHLYRANNASCTAKIVRQTFVFVEFEP
jgi:hypothetical protein